MSLDMILGTIAVVLVVWIVVRGLMSLERRSDSRTSAGRAEDLLRERFAAGEIDPDEFERRLAVLRG